MGVAKPDGEGSDWLGPIRGVALSSGRYLEAEQGGLHRGMRMLSVRGDCDCDA